MKYTSDNRTIEFNTQKDGNPSTFIHFKGKLYQIFTIAKDSETQKDIVVYQKQYDDFNYYVRDAKMFFSFVDKEKYPEVKQIYRFEKLV